MIRKVLFNPYEKIAGYTALIIGLVAMLVTSWMAAFNDIHFTGVLAVQLGGPMGFHVPFIENIINWAFLTITATIICKVASRSHFRIVDMAGTIALSRYPLLFATSLGFVPAIDRTDPYQMVNYLVGFGVIFCVVWSQILLFNAIRISANLKGDRRWTSYVILIVFTGVLSSVFYHKIYLLIL